MRVAERVLERHLPRRQVLTALLRVKRALERERRRCDRARDVLRVTRSVCAASVHELRRAGRTFQIAFRGTILHSPWSIDRIRHALRIQQDSGHDRPKIMLNSVLTTLAQRSRL